MSAVVDMCECASNSWLSFNTKTCHCPKAAGQRKPEGLYQTADKDERFDGRSLGNGLPAIPLSACAAFAHAFQALKQGQELHLLGLYDDAVGKCRVALETLLDSDSSSGADGVKRF